MCGLVWHRQVVYGSIGALSRGYLNRDLHRHYSPLLVGEKKTASPEGVTIMTAGVLDDVVSIVLLAIVAKSVT